MLIDAHAHLSRNPKDLDRVVSSGVIEQAWIMDTSFYRNIKVEILGGIQFSTQQEVLDVARDYPGFFIPFGWLDFSKGPEVVDRLKEKGFVGLKAIRPDKPYDDPSYFPHYERAEKLKMPVLFHTGFVLSTPYKVTCKMESGGRNQCATNMKPSALSDIASSFPELTIIGAHLGSPWGEETALALQDCANLYFDISGGDRHIYSQWLIDHLHFAAPIIKGNTVTTGGFSDKILMGIDALYGLREVHDDIFRAIKYWELFFLCHGRAYTWGKDVRKIMRLNARGIMKKALGGTTARADIH